MTMIATRDAILENLRQAPPPGQERLAYFQRLYGQLVGWISDPDRQWLVDFLPEYALARAREIQILEVGTFGGSTARGLVALTAGRITCMDDWREFHPAGTQGQSSPTAKSGPEFFWDNLEGYGADLSNRVAALLTGNSQTFGPKWATPIDVLLIDGDHSYAGASTDIQNFSPHVVPGGLLLVDDYDIPDVRRACDKLLEPANWNVVRAPTQPGKILALERRTP